METCGNQTWLSKGSFWTQQELASQVSEYEMDIDGLYANAIDSCSCGLKRKSDPTNHRFLIPGW